MIYPNTNHPNPSYITYIMINKYTNLDENTILQLEIVASFSVNLYVTLRRVITTITKK